MTKYELNKTYEIKELKFKVVEFNNEIVGRILNIYPNEDEYQEYLTNSTIINTSNDFFKSLSYSINPDSDQLNEIYEDLFNKSKDSRIELNLWINKMKSKYNLPRTTDFYGNYFVFSLGDI